MRYLISAKNLLVILLHLGFSSSYAQTEIKFTAVASKSCECKNYDFGEPTAMNVTVGKSIGGLCSKAEKEILCYAEHGVSYSCPLECVNLKIHDPLKKQDYLAALKIAEQGGRDSYAKMLPNSVLRELRSKYPDWVPVLINSSPNPEYFARFELKHQFYFEALISIAGRPTNVSIVYFSRGNEEVLQNTFHWSFWSTKTGAFLYESVAPYKSLNDSQVNLPCLAPAGKDLKDVVLFGIAAGPGDAAACCGPYHLNEVQKSGPIKIEVGSELEKKLSLDNLDMFSWMYSTCSRSSDALTGKFNPRHGQIDGPANIRATPSQSSSLVGKCSDKAGVALLSEPKDKWVKVYCEGVSGWTSTTNIRK